MFARNFRSKTLTRWSAMLLVVSGCTQYTGVVKPVPNLKALSPELAKFSKHRIEDLLKANVKPEFPSVLAVAKLVGPDDWRNPEWHSPVSDKSAYALAPIVGDEAEGWRKLAEKPASGGQSRITQVQFVSSLLAGTCPNLDSLRDASARLHAPLLLVYLQDSNVQEGFNDAAMVYWTIVGLFCVPGDTVGHYSACQALLIDTRTGLVVATAEGESKREEKVLHGACGIARDRTQREARAEAVNRLQAHFTQTLDEVALAQADSPSARAASR